MMYVCGECGAEIPEGMDFCSRCGCMRDKAFRVDEGGALSSAVCPGCGAPCGPADLFCGRCGARLELAVQVRTAQPRMRRNGTVAILLALIPGFFNIFGLGHFVLKEWSRGSMFVAITAVIWYLNGWQLSNSSFLVMVVVLGMYMYQAMDILRLAYSPERSGGPKKPRDERWTGRRSTARRHWTV